MILNSKLRTSHRVSGVFVPLCWTLALPSLAIIHSSASAQGLEEIIVTAQRREESLQDVPVSVSALTSEDLEVRGINGIGDMMEGAVPALRIIPFAGVRSTLQMTIRGIGDTSPTQVTRDKPVAFYLDGVYIARDQSTGLELADFERVEVLKGPQGTLFGRNAMAGAINITTQKPTGEFDFKLETEYSSWNTWRVRPTLNLPEFNDISVKLTYLHSESGGWINNPGGDDLDSWNDDGFRTALRWTPSDAVTLDYVYDHVETSYKQNYTTNFQNPLGLPIQPSVNERQEDTWIGILDDPSKEEQFGHALTLQWDLNDAMTFKTIAAYRELEVDAFTDLMGSSVILPPSFLVLPISRGQISCTGPATGPCASGSVSFEAIDQEQKSLELQLYGSTERLDWIVGSMWYQEEGLDRRESGVSINLSPIYSGGSPVSLAEPAALGNTNLTEAETKAFSLFAQATWKPPVLDDKLDLTLGLRYSDEEKDGCRPIFSGMPQPPGAQCFEQEANRVDPRIAIAYHWTPDTMTYLSYATAFRGGGTSVRDVTGLSPYDEDEVESIELGIKSEFLDNRLRLNAALFRNDFNDFQISIQNVAGSASSTRISNSPDPAKIEGLEFDLAVAVTDRLTLSGNYQYLNANDPITIDNPFIPNASLSVFIAQLPENAATTALDYAFPYTDFGRLDLHVDVNYSDDYFSNPSAGFAPVPDPHHWTIVNARLTLSGIQIGNNRSSLKLALWSKNLLDEDYTNFGFLVPGLNTQTRYYGDPRSVGISATFQY